MCYTSSSTLLSSSNLYNFPGLVFIILFWLNTPQSCPVTGCKCIYGIMVYKYFNTFVFTFEASLHLFRCIFWFIYNTYVCYCDQRQSFLFPTFPLPLCRKKSYILLNSNDILRIVQFNFYIPTAYRGCLHPLSVRAQTYFHATCVLYLCVRLIRAYECLLPNTSQPQVTPRSRFFLHTRHSLPLLGFIYVISQSFIFLVSLFKSSGLPQRTLILIYN